MKVSSTHSTLAFESNGTPADNKALAALKHMLTANYSTQGLTEATTVAASHHLVSYALSERTLHKVEAPEIAAVMLTEAQHDKEQRQLPPEQRS